MTGRHPLGLIPLSIGLLVAASSVAAETGMITGTVKGPGDVAAVVAIDRTNDKTYSGKLDSGTGKFTIDGLPSGGAFDCRVDYRSGARLEGINLKVPASDYEEEQPLSTDDIATIKRQVRDLNKFEDEVEILALSGNIQHASVLINKLRTRPFVNSKPGEVVWRAELWHFERPEETWLKSTDELFLVLYRKRLPREEYAKTSITFDPSLGGIAITAGRLNVNLGAIDPPAAGAGVRLRGTVKTFSEKGAVR